MRADLENEPYFIGQIIEVNGRIPNREVRVRWFKHIGKRNGLYGNGRWELLGYFNFIIQTDQYDNIEEDTILFEFSKFTKNCKLQKKVKEVIENHSELQWFGNRRNSNKNNRK